MKTNGDEKETHLAETTATYALGVFCQLVNPYISGVDHHKKGFMKDFFDAVLEGDILSNPPSRHHRTRRPGKTTITAGVWAGINETDLTRFYNGSKKIPSWKATEFYQHLDVSEVERLCSDISVDALADFQKELIKANIKVCPRCLSWSKTTKSTALCRQKAPANIVPAEKPWNSSSTSNWTT